MQDLRLILYVNEKKSKNNCKGTIYPYHTNRVEGFDLQGSLDKTRIETVKSIKNGRFDA